MQRYTVYCRTVRYAPFGSIRTCEPRYYSTPVNFLSFSCRLLAALLTMHTLYIQIHRTSLEPVRISMEPISALYAKGRWRRERKLKTKWSQLQLDSGECQLDREKQIWTFLIQRSIRWQTNTFPHILYINKPQEGECCRPVLLPGSPGSQTGLHRFYEQLLNALTPNWIKCVCFYCLSPLGWQWRGTAPLSSTLTADCHSRACSTRIGFFLGGDETIYSPVL